MNCEFKLNQKVWSPIYSWGILTDIYPIERLMVVKFDSSKDYTFTLVGAHAFKLDGSFSESEYPMIFHDKVDIKDWPCPKPNIANSLKVDDKVLVSKDDITYSKRHFAKYENSLVYTFANGLTSWSSDGNLAEWKYYELPNE